MAKQANVHIPDSASTSCGGKSFWDSSWETVDPARICLYADSFDGNIDPIVQTLISCGAKTICDAVAALQELYRITKPGGMILITLDSLDDEYRTEPHRMNENGVYLYTDGKWEGMVFHPYQEHEISEIQITSCRIYIENGEMTVSLKKAQHTGA